MSDLSAPRVLAFGDPDPLPFLGHFRSECMGPGSLLRVAGRWGSACKAVEASALAGALEAMVRGLPSTVDRPDDRVVLLRAFWDQLMVRAEALPAEHTADGALVVMAADARGVTVSGMGLAGCWFLAERQPVRPLVPANHPLLGPLGVPAQRPGGMTLNRVPEVLFAELRHPVSSPSGVPDGDLFAAAGARR